MILLYNLLWFFLFPLVFLLFPIISLLKGKKRSGLLQHFGFVGIHKEKFKGKNITWLQVLSVGEVATALPIIKELKNAIPNFAYVVSVTTEAGSQRAKKSFPDAEEIFFTPFDFYPSIANLMRKIQPKAILVVETGFWPNLLSCGKNVGATTILANGRISEKSYHHFKTFKPIANYLFGLFDVILTRDLTVSERLKNLGVAEGKITSFGDVKYDTLPMVTNEEKEYYRKLFSLKPDEMIVMAGNTHEGEEEFLLDIFCELKARFKKTILIFAPRRIERIPQIAKMLTHKGKGFVKRTELEAAGQRKADIILLDSIGELSKVYFICEIIFVGKSIFPPGGGHSLLEPVAAGKVVFHGPHVQYYEEAKCLLREVGLAVELEKKSGYLHHFTRILENKDGMKELQKRANQFLEKKKGASKKIAGVVQAKINQKE